LQGGSVDQGTPYPYLPSSNNHLWVSCGIQERQAILATTAAATGFEDYGDQEEITPNAAQEQHHMLNESLPVKKREVKEKRKIQEASDIERDQSRQIIKDIKELK
jgi:hypothetical protein